MEDHDLESINGELFSTLKNVLLQQQRKSSDVARELLLCVFYVLKFTIDCTTG